jgi:2-iminobutanoate/2-iminopropanoate deaminase
MKVELNVRTAPSPSGSYSQALIANGLLFTAGFGPMDPATNGIVGETIEEQTHQVIKNLLAVLESQGLDANAIVKSTVHLQNLDRDFAGFDSVYRSYLSAPYPVRTTVGSTLAGILVEIDVIAICSEGASS